MAWNIQACSCLTATPFGQIRDEFCFLVYITLHVGTFLPSNVWIEVVQKLIKANALKYLVRAWLSGFILALCACRMIVPSHLQSTVRQKVQVLWEKSPSRLSVFVLNCALIAHAWRGPWINRLLNRHYFALY